MLAEKKRKRGRERENKKAYVEAMSKRSKINEKKRDRLKGGGGFGIINTDCLQIQEWIME